MKSPTRIRFGRRVKADLGQQKSRREIENNTDLILSCTDRITTDVAGGFLGARWRKIHFPSIDFFWWTSGFSEAMLFSVFKTQFLIIWHEGKPKRRKSRTR